MHRRAARAPRLFTAQEANATLPLVRAIVQDITQLAGELVGRRERLSLLLARNRHQPQDLYGEELAQIEEVLERDSRQLREYAEELQALGVELKSALEGLVDFPAMREGRRVCLCWKLGEAEVAHWHELDAGFQGRQPLSGGGPPHADAFSHHSRRSRG